MSLSKVLCTLIKAQYILCGNEHSKKLQQRKPAYEQILCQLIQLTVTLSSVHIPSPQRMWNCHVKWSNSSKPSPLQWSYIGNSLPCVSYCSPNIPIIPSIISQHQHSTGLQRNQVKNATFSLSSCYTQPPLDIFLFLLFCYDFSSSFNNSMQGKTPLPDALCWST